MGTTLKALSLLDLFSTRHPELGLSQVTRMSGLNKATALRLLGELCEFGLLEQKSDTKLYRLGSTVLRLANQREMAFPTRSIARPILRECVGATGETVHMSLLDRFHLNTVAIEETQSHSVRVVVDPSEILPLHATASGLVVTAFGNKRLLEHLLTHDLHKVTNETVTNRCDLAAMISTIRDRGYAVAEGSFEESIKGIARPLFDGNQMAVGAIAAAIPTSRATPELEAKCLISLERAAEEITSALGGRPPHDYPNSTH